MDDEAPDPAIRIEITPRQYRIMAIGYLTLGAVALAAGIVLDTVFDDSVVNPLIGLIAIGYGIYCAVRARRQQTRVMLDIDRSGIRTADGSIDQSWNHVVMVWIGSSTGLRLSKVLTPTLYVYTGAGVDFARRARMRPKALVRVPVQSGMPMSRLCERLRTITEAQIVDGAETSRRDAEAALLRGR